MHKEIGKQFYRDIKIASAELEDAIFWEDNNAAGFTLLKEYPENIPFVPVKGRGSRDDSAVMIKIGYFINAQDGDQVKLLVSAYKISRYLQNNFHYDFGDDNSPTKSSVEASERSRQPVDLEEHDRFFYNVKTHKITDTEINKDITGDDLVQHIYDLHVKTTRALMFRSKVRLRSLLVDVPDYVVPILKWTMVIFGREIIEERGDFSLGLFKTYSYKKHVRQQEVSKIVPLGIPVPINAVVIASIFVTLLLIVDRYFGHDLFRLVSFLKEVSDNQLFLLAVAVVLFYGIDSVPPRIIFLIINLSIKIRLWAIKKKIKIY